MIKWLCAAFCAVLVTSAHAKTWHEAIRDVEALSNRYAQEVERRTGERVTYFLGAMHNPTDYKAHMCAILGRRLGHKQHISHLEPPQPPLTSEPEVLAINSISLSNWAHAARKFAAMSQRQRATYWNNECVDNFGIAQGLWVDVPRQAFSSVEGSQINIYGDINPGYADELIRVLQMHPGIKNVGLGSGGGSVRDAIKAGAYLRSGGYTTVLIGACQSACPLVFVGGVERHVFRGSEEDRRFGFHQVSANGRAVPIDHPIYAEIYQHLQRMGADADGLYRVMTAYLPHEMGYLDVSSECRLRIATWYQGYYPGQCP